uniref:Transmembrane protein 79-like n=1 Tax=Crassostrea virginica TaxID=6565 RepID=A0A8B8D8U4_CRAVI|nr:transmembrane protein 79-like [Crassostrea virginica]
MKKLEDKRTWQEKKAGIQGDVAISVVISVLVFISSYLFLPIDTSHLKELPDRLALTISCLFVSSFSVLMGIYLVGQIRGNSNAIDPVNGGAENLVDVRNRILRNTTEQFILHVMAMLTLTLFLEGTSMKVIPILSGIFLIARGIYQFGYMSSPMKRGYGFGSTFFPTIFVYAYCTFCIVTKLMKIYFV